MNENRGIDLIAEQKRCAGLIINELRGELLLGLKYAKGENANLLLVQRYILESLDEVAKLENTLE